MNSVSSGIWALMYTYTGIRVGVGRIMLSARVRVTPYLSIIMIALSVLPGLDH